MPFNEIDGFTEFNNFNHTITLNGNDGYNYYESTIYSKQGEVFIPTKYVKINNEGVNNTKYEYKINKNLQLIKKELLKD